MAILVASQALIHYFFAKNHDCISIDEDGNTVSGPWFCPTRDTDFPRDIWGALVTMFFVMVTNSRRGRGGGDMST